MDKTLKLSDRAALSLGLVLKRKQADANEKTHFHYKALTLESFEKDGWLNDNELKDYQSSEKLAERYLTKNDDVIIRLSKPHTVISIKEKHNGFLVPSLFAIVRLEDDSVDSGYLAFLLNSTEIKRQYSKASLGTTIPTLRVSDIKQIEIILPSLNRQKKIAHFSQLIIRQKSLYSDLLKENDRFYNEISKRMLRGGTKHGN